jgi:hypothetical protein
VARWLSGPDADTNPLVKWLVNVSAERSTLETALLLVAGLHLDVLSGQEASLELAHYFPTAKGNLSSKEPSFEIALRHAVWKRRESLGDFIRHGKVQTNETGRGLCWLLPAVLSGWTEVHVVDLGASAGLNLLADMRSFTLLSDEDQDLSAVIGTAEARQFMSRCRRADAVLTNLSQRPAPTILSRTGCDQSPFIIRSENDRLLLKSYIWADQLDRMERLCEAMEVYEDAQVSSAPVTLYRCRLPDELRKFLSDRVPRDRAPVIIYNTFMTAYLPDKGASLSAQIGDWASDQNRPVLWAQWEPARDEGKAYREEMNLWSADLWDGGKRLSSVIGWVHPHGGYISFEERWAIDLTRSLGAERI